MKNTIKFLEYCKMNHYGKLNHQYLRKVYKNGSSSPSTNERYIHRGYLRLGVLDMNNGANLYQALLWDPTEPQATRPLALLNNNGTYYYGHDFNKNVTELFNANGDIVNHYDYRPYGALLESSESIPNPIQYSSEIHDSEFGLISYNYRHYNPEDGRWLTRDPPGEEETLNLYRFIRNNPILWFDSLGRGAEPTCGGPSCGGGISVIEQQKAAVVLAPRPLLEGEVSLIYVSNQPGLDVPELCGDLVHVNEDTSTPSDFQPNQLLGEKACIKDLIILMHGGVAPSTIGPMAEVQWGDTALLETRDDTSLSDMFKGIRFCQPCTLELRSCDIGQQPLLKIRLEKNTGCKVILYDGGVGLWRT